MHTHTENRQKQHGIKHVIAAFGYTLCGLRAALNETAIRHELVVGIMHFIALAVLDLPFVSKLLLTCLWGGVLIVEMLNTAIEAVVDIASPGQNELAKKAKDLGSAAVFCALVVFGASWVLTIVAVTR